MAKDFYKILGVERKADEKDIKKAYRKLARQYHPDVNPNDKGAEAKFKEINEAFQVLSDKDKRALYDQFGADYDKAGPSPGGATGYPSGGVSGGVSGHDFNTVDLEELFNRAARQRERSGAANTRTEEVGDIFGSIFGGLRGENGAGKGSGFPFGGRRARGPQKGQDVEQPIEISLPESIKGTQRALQLTISDPSTGKSQTRNVTVKIPAGVRDGAQVRIAGKGASSDNGGPDGDLYLIISVAPHPLWKREGDDLLIEVPISFGEAALGATIEVPTQSSRVQLKIPAGTQSGQKFRLSGRGVQPKNGKAGDQYVTVKVAVPRELSSRERELIEELSSLRPNDVRRELLSAEF